MKYNIIKLFITFVCTFSNSLLAVSIDEQAFYKVNKDPRRTSSIIKAGELILSLDFMHDMQTYVLNLDYTINTDMMGLIKKQKKLYLPVEYFEEKFLIDLKQNGFYQTDKIKAKYLGQSTVKNMDGTIYENCDVIFLYDLNLESDILNQPTKLKFLIIYLSQGVPVIGASRLDVRENLLGLLVNIGFDLISQ